MTKRPPAFPTEAALCTRFIEAIDKRSWTPYAETCGWDILLVRKTDGFQIGVQAKLRCNVDVINQAIEYGSLHVDQPGPDCRAILVPDSEARGFSRIADYIGFTIIRQRAVPCGYNYSYSPDLPSTDSRWRNDHWHEWAPLQRHDLPEYVPDVTAGAPAPIQLTAWKISAIKIAVTLERRGYVTRADFKAHGIDHRRWLAAGSGWLMNEGGRYVAGSRMPDFKGQHPKVYQQIAAEADKWMPSGGLPLFTEGRST